MAYFESVTSSLESEFNEQSNDEDFLLALQLHDQLNKEEKENDQEDFNKIMQVHKKKQIDLHVVFPNRV